MIQELEDTFSHSVTNSKFIVSCEQIFRKTVFYINTFKIFFSFYMSHTGENNIFFLHIYLCLSMFKKLILVNRFLGHPET